jgi:chromate transporter
MRDSVLAPTATTERMSLGVLFWTFLKIGSVAFGGFMALISVVADTIVEKHQLLKQEDMLDCISLANLLPGPQGVNCVAYVGYRLRGGLGALVSAVGVLLPTFVLMVVLTGLYMAYASKVAVLSNLFIGFIPAVAAVIVSVVHRMAKNILQGQREILLTILAALVLLVAPRALRLYITLSIVGSFGLAGYALFRSPTVYLLTRQARLPWACLLGTLAILGLLVVAFLAHPPLAPRGLAQLALTLSGLSLLLFGGGYVFIPMMQDVMVTHYGWLTTQQFLDGVALSQVTPGPILVIATFIAQKVMMDQYGLPGGLLGAVVGTVSIFTPPAVLMITASMALDYIKHSPGMQAALRGIRCGVLGLLIVAALVILSTSLPTWPASLSIHALTGYLRALWPTVAIFVATLVALVKYNLDLVWIIPAAGLLGLLLY